MDKALRYQQLMLDYDRLAHKISQLKATNAGINLSDEILNEIKLLQDKQFNIEQEAIQLQGGL